MSEDTNDSEKPKFKVLINPEAEELKDKHPKRYRIYLSEGAMHEIFEMQVLTGVREPNIIIEEALAYYNFCCELENSGHTLYAKRKWWHWVVLILNPLKVRATMEALRKEKEKLKTIFKPKVIR